MNFNPARLTLARKRRGLNKSRLAAEAGFSVRIITAWEAGDIEPSGPNLEKLAKRLGFPVDFFRGPQLEELGEKSASFRALKRMTASQRDTVQAAGTLAIELLSPWIDQRFDLPAPDVPDLRHFGPEEAALALRAQWGLGEQPISNVVHLLEAKGIRVFSLAEECAEVDAFATWRHGRPFVFLNTFKSGERGRFDGCHELGHLVLHRHGPAMGQQIENEANAFASAFLMPRARLLAQSPPVVTLESLIKLKKGWGVSVAALAYRMHSIGILTEWNYRTLVIELSKRGYRSAEPEGISRETSLIFPKVFKSLAAQGVRKSDIARELGISLAELESLIFGLLVSSSPAERRVPVQEGPSTPPSLRLVGPNESENGGLTDW